MTQVIPEATTDQPALFHENIEGYDFLSRVEILQAQCGFLPSGHDETNDAFYLWFNATRHANTATILLDKVASRGASATNQRPEGAVESITTRYASYAKQARRDLGTLLRTGKDIVSNPFPDHDTPTLAYALAGVPPHDGPGQLVRYMDQKAFIDEGSFNRLGFDPFGGEVRDPQVGSRGVIDPYTRGKIEPEVSEHIAQVMNGTLASDAAKLFEDAANNQQSRLKFWADRLREAEANGYARHIAVSALKQLNVYPEYNQ